MTDINLNSILSCEALGNFINSIKVKHVRISAPEFSFSSAFNNDFTIGIGFRIEKLIATIINGSILGAEAFGNFTFPKIIYLASALSKEKVGNLTLDYLYIYSIGTILYVVDEAKHKRLEKVAIKEVILQTLTSSFILAGSNIVGSPYKNYNGQSYSILYRDTLDRIWEQTELTLDPQSFFDWYEKTTRSKNKERKVISVESLGKRKKNVNWEQAKLFLRKKAEKGVLERIKVKKASIRKGNVLVYFDEKNNSWEENELVFETMATILVDRFKNKKIEEGKE